MNNKADEIMCTESVKLDSDLVSIVRELKKHTGIGIGRFIEDAVIAKLKRLPKTTKEKIIVTDRKYF